MIKREELNSTDFSDVSSGDKQPVIRPGEILLDFLEDFDITPYRLAKDIDVPQTRIAAIIKEGRAITADTALRLSQCFGNTAEFWMNLQSQYAWRIEQQHIGEALNKIKQVAA